MAATSTARSPPAIAMLFETPIASHNLLRAHGRAVEVYRTIGKHAIASW